MKPEIYEFLDAFKEASVPYVLLAEKSITAALFEELTILEAFVASEVWKCISLINNVSNNCPSKIGALISITGSFGKKIVPSFIARIEPVNLKSLK